jgi:hypothetical protein
MALLRLKDPGMARRFALFALLAAATIGVVAAPASAAPPAVQAQYRFAGNLASSVAGAPNLQHVSGPGASGFATEDVDGQARTVLQFPAGNGLRLPNTTSVIPRDRYTIALLMRFQAVTGYRRIVSFKSATSPAVDTGLYVQNSDLVFYNRAFPTNDTVDADEWVWVVLTRSATGRLRGYVDGEQQFFVTDPNNRGVIGPQNALRFFVDNNDEESAGALSRLVLWDGVLTPDQVAARYPGG